MQWPWKKRAAEPPAPEEPEAPVPPEEDVGNSPADHAAVVEAVRRWIRAGRPCPRGELAALLDLDTQRTDRILALLAQDPDADSAAVAREVFS